MTQDPTKAPTQQPSQQPSQQPTAGFLLSFDSVVQKLKSGFSKFPKFPIFGFQNRPAISREFDVDSKNIIFAEFPFDSGGH